MRVFVTGGTGLVGTRLIRKLRRRGDDVVVLSRQADAWERVGQDVEIVIGDPTRPGDWQDKAAACDALINLAGTNIFAERWSPEFKQSIHDSRVQTTQNSGAALSRAPTRGDGAPKVLVNASAIGYYGPRGDEEITEDGPPGSDFLSGVCLDWENATKAGEAAGLRVVRLRIGIVLDSRGGALMNLMTPFRLGVGGPIGFGRQWWSWIHYSDMTSLILMALDDAAIRGPMNGTAPHPITSKEFAKILGRVLGRPAFMPVPGLALRVLMGQVAEVLTTGQRVIPRLALDHGYQFTFVNVESALANLLKSQSAAA